MTHRTDTFMTCLSGKRPRLVMVVGSLGIATPGVFIALQRSPPRLPPSSDVRWPYTHCGCSRRERRRDGPLSRRPVMVAAMAGVLFAADALSSTVNAAVLMLGPVGALGLTALFLDENPTQLQLFGCLLMLGGAYIAATRDDHDRAVG
ncbi:hypothetical protein ACFTS5_09660 [Nocardia sp. NPDC056952]|uniref:hypothetical protein n=1 Tax=Nocardia sp. NPDC056952 TaxID=3345979 RepID=UPI0036332121